jgi:hypothetical protein
MGAEGIPHNYGVAAGRKTAVNFSALAQPR